MAHWVSKSSSGMGITIGCQKTDWPLSSQEVSPGSRLEHFEKKSHSIRILFRPQPITRKFFLARIWQKEIPTSNHLPFRNSGEIYPQASGVHSLGGCSPGLCLAHLLVRVGFCLPLLLGPGAAAAKNNSLCYTVLGRGWVVTFNMICKKQLLIVEFLFVVLLFCFYCLWVHIIFLFWNPTPKAALFSPGWKTTPQCSVKQ